MNAALPLGLAAVVGVVAIYAVALKTRHHYTSVLICPRCGRTFEYNWVPLVSFTAVRLGTSRLLQCPLCHEWSNFEIWSTRKKEAGQT